jgi:hypothetical protein
MTAQDADEDQFRQLSLPELDQKANDSNFDKKKKKRKRANTAKVRRRSHHHPPLDRDRRPTC